MTMIAGYRKNGAFGFKSLVTYTDGPNAGSTHIPIRKNFADPVSARAYAQKWIDANLANQARHEAARIARHTRRT
jgi:hypothetical protein